MTGPGRRHNATHRVPFPTGLPEPPDRAAVRGLSCRALCAVATPRPPDHPTRTGLRPCAASGTACGRMAAWAGGDPPERVVRSERRGDMSVPVLAASTAARRWQ